MNRITRRTSSGAIPWAVGAGAGALLAFFADPSSGRRRRAMLRDKGEHLWTVSTRFLRKASADLRHRRQGLVAETRLRIEERLAPEPVPDDLLVERARAKMGTVVSHPAAIEITADGGVLDVRGPILEREADPLIRVLQRVRGVQGVEDRLERYPEDTTHPALQGGVPRTRRPDVLQQSWAPATRLVAGLVGAALAVAGAVRRGLGGLLGAGLGGGLLLRATTNLSSRRLLGVGAGRRAVDVQKDLHIDASPDDVFAYLERFERFPEFMDHLHAVERTDGAWRFVAKGPAGAPLTWDVEVVELVRGERIAWRSVKGSPVQSKGAVRVDPEGSGSRLEIRMSYNPPGGAVGHALLKLLGSDPKRAFDDDLLRLKSLLESGAATGAGRTVHRQDVLQP